MRTEFGYAWGKLYLAVLGIATSTAPLPERVVNAFRTHLRSLNSHNLPPLGYELLKAVRARLVYPSDEADDDTLDISYLTPQDAAVVAEEIFSLYDEIARTDG
jgi:hypothetical protein